MEGCRGYSINTSDGIEYNCEYESGIDYDKCIFGKYGGKQDPRINEEVN